MVRGKTAKRNWVRTHRSDPYVRRAAREGYRSRAAYKLQEIDRRERLLAPGRCVVELGAAPGGWTQYAAERIAPGGMLVAVDLQQMSPLTGVTVMQGDFRDLQIQDAVRDALNDRPVDLVLSDLAPNITGIGFTDAARAEALQTAALEFAVRVLRPGGAMLVKLFAGAGVESVTERFAQRFARCTVRKPAASRSRSREFYLLARDYRGDG